MSVTCYYGATEHGKSYHVEKQVVPQWKKVIVLDPTGSFTGSVFVNPDKKKILEIFRRFASLESYRIIIRPNENSNDDVLCRNFCILALLLGEALGKNVGPSDRVQAIVDETGDFCHSGKFPPQLKKLVKKGRHVNTDSHFIVQDPMAIHNQIRSNSTKICSFYLGNASTVPAFTERFPREICLKIMELPKYYRFEWVNNGFMAIFDEKNRIVINFPKKSFEIPPKITRKKET